MAAWTFGTVCIAVADRRGGGRKRRRPRGDCATCTGGNAGPRPATAWVRGGCVPPTRRRPVGTSREPSVSPRPQGETGSGGTLGARGRGRRRPGPARLLMAIVVPPFFVSAVVAPGDVGPNEVTNWSQLQLHRVRGPVRPGPNTTPSCRPCSRSRRLRLRARDVGVQLEREPLRHARGAHAAALLDERLRRLHGGPALRIVDDDALPLHRPGRALPGALRSRGRSALRPRQRRPRRAAPPIAGREVLHGRDARGGAAGQRRS